MTERNLNLRRVLEGIALTKWVRRSECWVSGKHEINSRVTLSTSIERESKRERREKKDTSCYNSIKIEKAYSRYRNRQ